MVGFNKKATQVNYVLLKEKITMKILFQLNIQKQKFKPDFNPYCPLGSLTMIYSDGGIYW